MLIDINTYFNFLQVFRDLKKARQSFVLENELHIIYQVIDLNMFNMNDNKYPPPEL